MLETGKGCSLISQNNREQTLGDARKDYRARRHMYECFWYNATLLDNVETAQEGGCSFDREDNQPLPGASNCLHVLGVEILVVEVLTLMLRWRMFRCRCGGIQGSGLRLDNVTIRELLAFRCDWRGRASVLHDRGVWVLVRCLRAKRFRGRLGLVDDNGGWRCWRSCLTARDLCLALKELIDGSRHG